MEDKPVIKVPFPGPNTMEMFEELRKYEYPAEYVTKYEIPPIIAEASGTLVKDVDGNVYLDFTGGFAALNAGHCHPKLIKAAIDQMKRVHHTAQIPTESRVRFVKKMVEIAPGGLKNNSKVVFDQSGSGAVEVALKLARAFTKRSIIISFYGGYHGRGGKGALEVTSEAMFYKGIYPGRPAVVSVPYPYCYRCYFEREYPDCDLFCLRYLERLLSDPKCCLRNVRAGVNLVAGVIFEPALGGSGYIIPPDEFWPGVRKLCDECNILMIDDEIQMGWGRSGKMFCIDHWNVTPDIMTLGKSIAGGLNSFALAIGRSDIVDVFVPNYHGVTFGGNPIGSAVALAMIELLQKEKLPEHAADIGKYLLKGLKDLESEHPIIGHVDGKGLIIGIEFVKDRKTKEPAPEENMEIIKEAIKRGLLLNESGFFGNRINIIPPLIIQKEHVDSAIEILGDVIGAVERKL